MQIENGLGLTDGAKDLNSEYKQVLSKTMKVGEWKLETTNKAYLAKKPSNNFNNIIENYECRGMET